MKVFSIVFLFILVAMSVTAKAALPMLPVQFSECLGNTNPSQMTYNDLKEISKVAKITYCQNQSGLIGKMEIRELLTNPNVQIGISIGKTTYTYTDLLDIAQTRSFVLYVDSTRLSRENLVSLSQAGVQLVIISSMVGYSKSDLMQIAAAKPFILNVNSAISRADLRDYVMAGVQIVIRTGQAGLSRADITEVAALNSALVTVLP